MTREVTLAATQFACAWDVPANLDAAEGLVREAAGRGAQIVLLQELFATPYFPITQTPGTSTWPGRRRATRSSRASAGWPASSRSSSP